MFRTIASRLWDSGFHTCMQKLLQYESLNLSKYACWYETRLGHSSSVVLHTHKGMSQKICCLGLLLVTHTTNQPITQRIMGGIQMIAGRT